MSNNYFSAVNCYNSRKNVMDCHFFVSHNTSKGNIDSCRLAAIRLPPPDHPINQYEGSRLL